VWNGKPVCLCRKQSASADLQTGSQPGNNLCLASPRLAFGHASAARARPLRPAERQVSGPKAASGWPAGPVRSRPGRRQMGPCVRESALAGRRRRERSQLGGRPECLGLWRRRRRRCLCQFRALELGCQQHTGSRASWPPLGRRLPRLASASASAASASASASAALAPAPAVSQQPRALPRERRPERAGGRLAGFQRRSGRRRLQLRWLGEPKFEFELARAPQRGLGPREPAGGRSGERRRNSPGRSAPILAGI